MSSVDARREASPRVRDATGWQARRLWGVVPHVVVLGLLVVFPLVALSGPLGVLVVGRALSDRGRVGLDGGDWRLRGDRRLGRCLCRLGRRR